MIFSMPTLPVPDPGQPAAGPAQGQRRRLLPGSREAWTAWAMLLPALLGLLLFYGLPAVRAVQISFTDWSLLRPARDVGWANYQRLLQDDNFWHALKLSLYYVLLNIPLQTVLGLFLAVVMHRLTRSLFVKAVVLLPYLLSNVLVALIWLWLLDPVLGWVNHALVALAPLGAGPQPFFAGPDQALATMAAVNVWRHMGLVAMLFLAGPGMCAGPEAGPVFHRVDRRVQGHLFISVLAHHFVHTLRLQLKTHGIKDFGTRCARRWPRSAG